MKVAIINCPRELGLDWRLTQAFCAKWLPYHIEDEDGLKEEWQTKHFQNIQISEYDYYDLDRLVDEILYIDGEVLVYE